MKELMLVLALLTGDGPSGCGFVCEMDGGKYFVTNRHLLEGRSELAAQNLDGDKLKFTSFEVAEDADLARLAVPEETPALKLREDPLGEKGSVFTYALGKNGMLSKRTGRVDVARGKTLDEAVRFGADEGGSAVLDASNCVVGVACWRERPFSPEIWLKKSLKPLETDRYVVPLTNHTWQVVDFAVFQRKAAERSMRARQKAGAWPQCTARFEAPQFKIVKAEKGYSVGGRIVISFTGAGSTLKNPLVRMVLVVRGTDGLHFVDQLLMKPFTNKAEKVPKFPGLEGLSYQQAAFAGVTLKGVTYFDPRTSQGEGYFKVPADWVADGKSPELVAVRLECWQNGGMAGSFDSLSAGQQKKLGWPDDWSAPHLHPELFTY